MTAHTLGSPGGFRPDRIKAAPLGPSIGIIGGMGPLVDPLILQKCLQQQAKLGIFRDQNAMPILLAQYPALIHDRTAFLELLERGDMGPNPGAEAARIASRLVADGARVLGIPCNTFHAAPIFSTFQAELSRSIGDCSVHVIDMIETTVKDIVTAQPEIRRVGIVSTNGSLRQRLFAGPLAARNLEAITLKFESQSYSVDEQNARSGDIRLGWATPTQNDVHHCIYNPDWGIKSGRESDSAYPTARAILRSAVTELARSGAEAIILGCTELPLALGQADAGGIRLYDPLDSLACGLVGAYGRRGVTDETTCACCAQGGLHRKHRKTRGDNQK